MAANNHRFSTASAVKNNHTLATRSKLIVATYGDQPLSVIEGFQMFSADSVKSLGQPDMCKPILLTATTSAKKSLLGIPIYPDGGLKFIA